MGISHASQVLRARLDVQLTQHCVGSNIASLQVAIRGSLGSFKSPNTMAWVGQAVWQAERISPSCSGSAFGASLDLAVLHALDAVGAFFHDAATADGHLGIEYQLLQLATRLFNLALLAANRRSIRIRFRS
jgi:hypothetical protein